MPIEVGWYDESHTVILWSVGESWTLEEFYDAHRQTLALMNGRDQGISTIVDATCVTRRPRQNLISHFQKVLNQTPLDALVYVHDGRTGRFIEMMVNIVVKITPTIRVQRVRFAHTVEQALEILRDEKAA